MAHNPNALTVFPTEGTVSLREVEAEQVGPLQQVQIYSLYADTILRSLMVLAIVGIFVWLNYEVMQFVWQAWGRDVAMISNKQIGASDRLVTPNVVMSLIGATVVQVGVGTIAIVSYFFPKSKA